ncbi:hypothetical protein [Actinomadura rubrisoli]|uniref:Uncharacterized protein n=1 Tax=Actinomadura rubrisoli TaxID=2530368 RepID=A0A4R5BZ75_9ACTN|nr:hypothetical protein [Actinomadura rubrisoli]TDD90760.1 hypothetical protein E1298_12730 [Actinomadura rubrisoli]
MSTVPAADDVEAQKIEAQKTALRAEFPAWSIIHTRDTGRWWATRGPLVREDLNQAAAADADTPDGLRSKLRELTAPRTRDGL